MNTLKMMIGLPRSGKSTWVKNNRTTEVIVSADELRKIVYGQPFWVDGETLVWCIREMFLKSLLFQGVDIIIDETNTTFERRNSIIVLAKKYGYNIEAIYIQEPFSTCINRAVDEKKDFLIPTIERMAIGFIIPEYYEGYDKITIIKDYIKNN